MHDRERGISARLILPNTAKTVDIVSETNIGVAWILVVTIRRAEVVGTESPGTATNHFGFALVRSPGVLSRTGRVIVHAVKIIAPFPDVAASIKQSPGIGAFLTDWPGTTARIFVEPGIVAQLGRIVAKKISGSRSGPAGILIFCLGRQSISGRVEVALPGFEVVAGL